MGSFTPRDEEVSNMRLPQARSIVVGWFSALSACGPTGAPGSDPGDGAAESASAADGASSEASGREVSDGPSDGGEVSEGSDSDNDVAVDNYVKTGLEMTEPYPAVTYPVENPYSPAKAVLGKILFWEEQLGSKSTVACGTCHRPEGGGSDPRASEPLSLGAGPNRIKGDTDDVHGGRGIARCNSVGVAEVDPVYGLDPQVTTRKPPSYLDAMFYEELFWDGRAKSRFIDPVTAAVAIETGGALESQAAGPPVSDVEMSCEGYQWTDIERKLATAKPLALATDVPAAMATVLAEHPTYPDLFAWAYGTPEITARKIVFAIATHERQLTSNDTPWDRYNAGNMAALTKDQERGLALFNNKAGCQKCHVPPLFTDGKFHNVGFQDRNLDPGRSMVTGAAEDLGKMKTPSLRNVGLRAGGGLMHNGTFHGASLEAVVIAYDKGGFEREGIDPEIHQLDLSDEELGKLLDFLQNGLTDDRGAHAAPPFDHPTLSSQR
jgi:cytochrome c peroxidase